MTPLGSYDGHMGMPMGQFAGHLAAHGIVFGDPNAADLLPWGRFATLGEPEWLTRATRRAKRMKLVTVLQF